MDFICFFIRYTPFWAVPLLFISIEFAHRYWRKERRKVARSFFVVAIFSLASITLYYWLGGPEKSVKIFLDLLQ